MPPADSVQQVLTMSTTRVNLRDEATGWSCEDPSLYVAGKDTGFTPGVGFRYRYSTPLAAMADGWRLLGPPDIAPDGEVEWWFVREVSHAR